MQSQNKQRGLNDLLTNFFFFKILLTHSVHSLVSLYPTCMLSLNLLAIFQCSVWWSEICVIIHAHLGNRRVIADTMMCVCVFSFLSDGWQASGRPAVSPAGRWGTRCAQCAASSLCTTAPTARSTASTATMTGPRPASRVTDISVPPTGEWGPGPRWELLVVACVIVCEYMHIIPRCVCTRFKDLVVRIIKKNYWNLWMRVWDLPDEK